MRDSINKKMNKEGFEEQNKNFKEIRKKLKELESLEKESFKYSFYKEIISGNELTELKKEFSNCNFQEKGEKVIISNLKGSKDIEIDNLKKT